MPSDQPVTVYKITCESTGRVYVGITVTPLANRLKSHRRDGRKTYLARCIKKYGHEKFRIEPLLVGQTIDAARKAERALILGWKLNICAHPNGNGMNMTDGGEGTFGCSPSAETRALISAKNRGRRRTTEQRARLSASKMGEANGMYGRKPSPIATEKARLRFTGSSNPNFGKRGQLSRFYKPERHVPKPSKQKLRSVQALDPETRTVVIEFPTMEAAARAMGTYGADIQAQCKPRKYKKRPTKFGYAWRFVDDAARLPA